MMFAAAPGEPSITWECLWAAKLTGQGGCAWELVPCVVPGGSVPGMVQARSQPKLEPTPHQGPSAGSHPAKSQSSPCDQGLFSSCGPSSMIVGAHSGSWALDRAEDDGGSAPAPTVGTALPSPESRSQAGPRNLPGRPGGQARASGERPGPQPSQAAQRFSLSLSTGSHARAGVSHLAVWWGRNLVLLDRQVQAASQPALDLTTEETVQSLSRGPGLGTGGCAGGGACFCARGMGEPSRWPASMHRGFSAVPHPQELVKGRGCPYSHSHTISPPLMGSPQV